MGRKKWSYRKKKPDRRIWKKTKHIASWFGKTDKNPTAKFQASQDSLEKHGTKTLVRINERTKKWELWIKKKLKKKRG